MRKNQRRDTGADGLVATQHTVSALRRRHLPGPRPPRQGDRILRPGLRHRLNQRAGLDRKSVV